MPCIVVPVVMDIFQEVASAQGVLALIRKGEFNLGKKIGLLSLPPSTLILLFFNRLSVFCGPALSPCQPLRGGPPCLDFSKNRLGFHEGSSWSLILDP